MSTTDPGVRDAVRQLGRAVGTLVHAVVGIVGRKRPATAAPADSGPPQEWLDLVAETDPDWLARSQWADRVRVSRPPARRSAPRPRATRVEPAEEASSVEESLPTGAPVLPQPSHRRSAGAEPEVEPDEPIDASRAVERPKAVGRQPRRLLPVDPPEEVASYAEADPPPPVQPTASDRAHATAHLSDETRNAAAEADKSPVDWPALPVPDTTPASHLAPPNADESSPYSPLETLRPVPQPAVREQAEPVRTVPERPRVSAAQPVRGVRLPPPTLSKPQAQPAAQPQRPNAASASVWPELPRTESLDSSATDAGPGLAALIWRTDGAPDTLTTAQRRS